MKALVVGGSSGIGLSIVLTLVQRSDVEQVFVMDKKLMPAEYVIQGKITEIECDLSNPDFLQKLEMCPNVQMLYITAGYGHLKLFGELSSEYISNIFAVNTVAPIQIVRHYYDRMVEQRPFYCAVMVSIAGRLNSPFFSVYSGTKAALSKCIEAVNVELDEHGSLNRILEVSPGSLKGTGFSGGTSNPKLTMDLAREIVTRSERRELLYIPQYDEVFQSVIERYHTDAHQFGKESYLYKVKTMEERK